MAADKLVDSTKLENALTATANAIRAKTSDSATIAFDMTNNKGFADAVDAIPSGGGAKTYTLKVSNVFGGTTIYFGSSDGFQKKNPSPGTTETYEVLCGTPIYFYSPTSLIGVDCTPPLQSEQIGTFATDKKRQWLLTEKDGAITPGDEITVTVTGDD